MDERADDNISGAAQRLAPEQRFRCACGRQVASHAALHAHVAGARGAGTHEIAFVPEKPTPIPRHAIERQPQPAPAAVPAPAPTTNASSNGKVQIARTTLEVLTQAWREGRHQATDDPDERIRVDVGPHASPEAIRYIAADLNVLADVREALGTGSA